MPPSWEAAQAGLPPAWQAALGGAFAAPGMQALAEFIAAERAAGKLVYPADADIFAALHRTPLDQVQTVILGQDPYHRAGQAMGLSFSVPAGVAIPPSLRNIHKELAADLGVPVPAHGSLAAWAGRGVLLLNTALTVEAGKPGSHARAGWHRFTDRVIAAVNAGDRPVAFLLWGGHAQKRAALLDGARHLVHMSEHPSPLAAYRGFFGSRPFTKVNRFLQDRGSPGIDWRLPG